MKINSSLLAAAFSAFVCSGRCDDVVIRFYPEATVLPEKPLIIDNAAPGISKISWNGDLGPGFIIANRPTMSPHAWNTFSTDIGVGNPTRHTVVKTANQEYFSVANAPAFAVGETVNWGASLTNLPPGITEQQCTGDMMFDDGTSYSIPGNSWSSRIAKTYGFMGLKTAELIVSGPNGLRATNRWAVAITNSPNNLVTNGDFELQSGSLPAGWNKGGFGSNTPTFIYPVSGFNGSSNAAQIVMTNYSNGDSKWYPNDVAVQGGNAKYHLTVWFTSTAPMNLTVRYTHTNGVFSYEGITILPPSPTWDQVERDIYPDPDVASVTVFSAIVGNGSLTIDTVSIVRIPVQAPLPEALLSFDIDDNDRVTSLEASNRLQNAGYRGTYYIVTPRVGLSGILTTNDLHNLKNAGHDIGAHSLGHIDLTATNLPLETLEREINISKQDLISWGLGPISAFAYPFGAYNSTVLQLTREAGFSSASSTDGGLNQRGVNIYALKRTSARSSMTFNDFKAMIDSAIIQKQSLILVFHHIDSTVTDYSITPALFQQIVDYAKLTQIKVVTASELVQILNQ